MADWCHRKTGKTSDQYELRSLKRFQWIIDIFEMLLLMRWKYLIFKSQPMPLMVLLLLFSLLVLLKGVKCNILYGWGMSKHNKLSQNLKISRASDLFVKSFLH